MPPTTRTSRSPKGRTRARAADQPRRRQPTRENGQLPGSPFPAWFGDNHRHAGGGGLLFCACHNGGAGRYRLASESFVAYEEKASVPAEERRCRGCASASQAAPRAERPSLFECHRIYAGGTMVPARSRRWQRDGFDGEAAADWAVANGYGPPAVPAPAVAEDLSPEQAAVDYARQLVLLVDQHTPEGACSLSLRQRLVAWRADVAGAANAAELRTLALELLQGIDGDWLAAELPMPAARCRAFEAAAVALEEMDAAVALEEMDEPEAGAVSTLVEQALDAVAPRLRRFALGADGRRRVAALFAAEGGQVFGSDGRLAPLRSYRSPRSVRPQRSRHVLGLLRFLRAHSIDCEHQIMPPTRH